MGYRVHTPDGEITYGNLEQLRQALDFGLVTLDTPVVEDEGGQTRSAGQILGRVVTTPSEVRRRARRWRHTSPAYALMSLALLALLFRELPRPVLRSSLAGPHLALEPAPPFAGGVVTLPEWLWTPAWMSLPALAWSDVAVSATFLLLLLFGLRVATIQASAFCAAVGGYFFATGQFFPAIAVWAAALLLTGNCVAHWVRRPMRSALERG